MDVIAAYRDEGTYRGTAAICGTTHKTVRRIIETHQLISEGGYPAERVSRAKNYDALADFRAALLQVPPDHACLVLHNTAVTNERLGDLEADATDGAEDAMDHYRAGREVLAGGPCLQPETQSSDNDQPQGAEQDLASATRQLDAQLVDKIRALLDARDQRERAALSPEELEQVERLERRETRAAQREQRTQQNEDPGDHASDEEVYGW